MMIRLTLSRGLLLFCILFSACICRASDVQSDLVYFGPDGRLEYGYYANEGETNADNLLPDFSYAGYMGGGVPLPDVPVVLTLSPRDGDDTTQIQNAINHVGNQPLNAEGFRGAVLLSAGRYQVTDTLRIQADGVVLRGEGQDELGTIIEATDPRDYNVIVLGLNSSSYSSVSGTLRRITSAYVPVGTKTFQIENTSGYSVGDRIGITYTRNQFWIDDLDMGQWDWTPSSYSLTYERTITAISGNLLTVDIPLVDVIQDKYGGGEVFRLHPTPRTRQSGVEHLRLVSGYAHDTDEDHPWVAVRVQHAENCWVRGVTAKHFAYSTVAVAGLSRNITVQDCAYLDPKSLITGARRYSFTVLGLSTNILFQRNYSELSRHDFVTHSRLRGPNVFVDGYAHASYSDSGPHHRWAAGNLFDNIFTTDRLAVENRGPSGTGHGWSGVQTVFWNCKADKGQKCHSPKGGMNFAIGSNAQLVLGSWFPDEPLGWWEHQWQTVTPRSLYYQQLQDRLGPEAVGNVTYPAQREGTIWQELKDWAGQDYFQPSPLISDEPMVYFDGDDAILEVQPLPEATIVSYQWYEIVGDTYEPIGLDMEVLVVPNALEDVFDRTFFCRVVTNLGPYWSATAVVDKKGLIAHWTLNMTDFDAENSLHLDVSGEGNHAESTLPPIFTDGVTGDSDAAVVMGSNYGFVKAGRWDPSEYTEMFSVTAWIKLNEMDYQHMIASKRDGWAAEVNRWGFRVHPDTNAIGLFNNGGGSANSDVELSPDDWYHVVCTFDNGNVRFYVNGAEAGQANGFILNPATAATLNIGSSNGTAHPLEGAMDDVRIYNTALTYEDILDVYYASSGKGVCLNRPQFDFTGDCTVGIADFALFASQWLECGLSPQTACP